jgi:nitrite reductase/ring-hydroxylating ferredoxin subunit
MTCLRDWGLIMSEVEKVECPNHGANFDCNPFCGLCEGEQEYVRGN